MAEPSLDTIVQRLQRLAGDGPAGVPDAGLLQRFAAGRDAAAFELLVWRHGAMVLTTCRRVLGPGPDVEDAFQATFLALVRQARAVRGERSLAGWLHRVAHRVSLHARKRRRARRETPLEHPVAVTAPEWSDVRPVLDEEIDRLPERLRLAVVLCYLEGKTTEEAGRLLGVPKGTVLSRLARARERLRLRLTRRGVTLAAGGVAALAATDSLPAAVVDAALRTVTLESPAAVAPAVAALTEGVVRTMFLSKLKVVAAGVLLAAAVLGTGTVAVTRPGLRAEGQPPSTRKAADKAAPKAADESSLRSLLRKPPTADSLQGSWKVVSLHERGERQPVDGMRWVFGSKSVQITETGQRETSTVSYTVDPAASPPAIDLEHGAKTVRGVYQLNGNRLLLMLAFTDKNRPALNDRTATALVLEREADPPAGAVDKDTHIKALQDRLVYLHDALLAEQAKQKELLAQIATARAVAEQEQVKAAEARKTAERLAADSRDQALAERRRAEAALQEAMAMRDRLEQERRKLELTLKVKDEEIAQLRSKLPVDRWDAGWSEIRVNVDGRWSLRILPDGSGIWGYGAQLDDFATLPGGTFTFEQVRRDLLAKATLDGREAASEVVLKRKGENGALTVYAADATPGLNLLKAARAKSTTPSLEARWQKSFPSTKETKSADNGLQKN